MNSKKNVRVLGLSDKNMVLLHIT